MSKQTSEPSGVQIGTSTQRAVKLSLRLTAIAVLVTLVLAAVLAGAIVGISGLQSVGLCAIAGAVMLLITLGSHLFTLRNPELMMAGMGADFVLKLMLFLGLVAVARQLPWLNPLVLFLTMLALILVQTLVFSVAVTHCRIPLLDQSETVNVKSLNGDLSE